MKVRVSYSFVTTVRGWAEVDVPEGMSAEEFAASPECLQKLEAHRESIPSLAEASAFDFDWVADSDEAIQVDGVDSDGEYLVVSSN